MVDSVPFVPLPILHYIPIGGIPGESCCPVLPDTQTVTECRHSHKLNDTCGGRPRGVSGVWLVLDQLFVCTLYDL